MNLSIRIQLLLFTLALILLGVNLTAGIALYIQVNTLEENHKHFGEEMIEIVAQNLLDPLHSLEIHKLNAQIGALTSNDDIRSVIILDKEGIVLTDGTEENPLEEARYEPLTPIIQQLASSADPFLFWDHDNSIAITHRIETPFKEFLGYLHVELDREDIDEAVEQMVIEFLQIEGILILFSIAAALLLSSYFHRPLRQAVATANAIASGHYQTTYTTERRDEFGMLNNALHQMSSNIQHTISELHETQQEMEEIFRSMVDGVIVIDHQGSILKVNRKIEALTQLQSHELVGEPLNSIIPETITTNDLSNIDRQHTLMTASGGELTVQINSAKIQTTSSATSVSAVLVVHDMSEQIRAERQEQYAAFQAGIAEMGASVLHNIGNVITGMVGNLMKSRQILRITDKLPNKMTSYANESIAMAENPAEGSVEEITDRLQESSQVLIKTAEAMVKINTMTQESGTLDKLNHGIQHISDIISIQQSASRPVIHASNFSLRSMVDDTLSLIEDRLNKYQIEKEIHLSPELDLVTLPRNPLIQLMLNLIKNSMEAITEKIVNDEDHSDGFIRITTVPRGSDYFTIVVEDSGCGFEPEKIESIFQTGYTTKSEGSGYGLHSAANFVHQLGGEITAESRGTHQGMKMTVLLPLKAPAKKKIG